MPEIIVNPPSDSAYAVHLNALCELETELQLRRFAAADRSDWDEVSRLLKEQSFVLCDIAKAVDYVRGAGGGN